MDIDERIIAAIMSRPHEVGGTLSDLAKFFQGPPPRTMPPHVDEPAMRSLSTLINGAISGGNLGLAGLMTTTGATSMAAAPAIIGAGAAKRAYDMAEKHRTSNNAVHAYNNEFGTSLNKRRHHLNHNIFGDLGHLLPAVLTLGRLD